MKLDIKTIKLGGLTGNCYLIKTTNGFILIVTGEKTKHQKLEVELTQLGCTNKNLNLIIFTHSNSFNYSNYAFLREKYQAKIAMHIIDKALINEKESLNIEREILKLLKMTFFVSTKNIEFKPDFIIDEGYNLSEYGLNARVLYLPGYSNSIGILTENGELFCDDIIEENNHQLNTINQNLNYLKKLKNLLVDIIYPRHGDPFPLQSLNI
ncbi:hypothetical protein ACFLS4_04825 [Bacteroidota bacterium]